MYKRQINNFEGLVQPSSGSEVKKVKERNAISPGEREKKAAGTPFVVREVYSLKGDTLERAVEKAIVQAASACLN